MFLFSPNCTLYLQLCLNYRDTNHLPDVHTDLIFGKAENGQKILSDMVVLIICL